MPETKQLGRDELKQLRPGVHLKPRGGFDGVNQPRDLAGNFATAACSAFEYAEVAPQELLTVYEALKQCLAISDEKNAAAKVVRSTKEALEVAGSLLSKKINRAIVDWLRECLPLVQTDQGIAAFLQHMTSVVQQYSLIVGAKHRV